MAGGRGGKGGHKQRCVYLQGDEVALTEQAEGGTDGSDWGEGSCLHAWAKGAAITS